MKFKKKIIEFLAMEMAMQDAKIVPDFGFQIFISRNLKRLEAELEAVKEKGKPSDEFQALAGEFEKLRGSLADKDEKGNPIIITENGGQRYQVTDVPKFEKESEKFWKKEENAKLKTEQEKAVEEYRKHINDTEIEIDLITFNTKHIPSEFFSKEENRRVLVQVTDLMEELFN